MPSTYRSNISWRSKKEHDEAKEHAEKNNTSVSAIVQAHFRRIIPRKK